VSDTPYSSTTLLVHVAVDVVAGSSECSLLFKDAIHIDDDKRNVNVRERQSKSSKSFAKFDLRIVTKQRLILSVLRSNILSRRVVSLKTKRILPQSCR